MDTHRVVITFWCYPSKDMLRSYYFLVRWRIYHLKDVTKPDCLKLLEIIDFVFFKVKQVWWTKKVVNYHRRWLELNIDLLICIIDKGSYPVFVVLGLGDYWLLKVRVEHLIDEQIRAMIPFTCAWDIFVTDV